MAWLCWLYCGLQEKIVWSRQGHLGLPADLGHSIYTLYWMYLFGLVYWGVVGNQSQDGGLLVEAVFGISTPQFVVRVHQRKLTDDPSLTDRLTD